MRTCLTASEAFAQIWACTEARQRLLGWPRCLTAQVACLRSRIHRKIKELGGFNTGSSFYDNSELVNNVTHYAFWRHFDPTGAPITDVAEGAELLGEMPSLSLNNYAYQAPTLGNTNAFGDFSSCYFVAATADDDTTGSNVMCGESVDNPHRAIPTSMASSLKRSKSIGRRHRGGLRLHGDLQ